MYTSTLDELLRELRYTQLLIRDLRRVPKSEDKSQLVVSLKARVVKFQELIRMIEVSQ